MDVTQFELIILASSLVGVWLKHQQDYQKLKGRVIALETQSDDIKDDLKLVLREITAIKLLLAKNQME